jgi:hypothetical protein
MIIYEDFTSENFSREYSHITLNQGKVKRQSSPMKAQRRSRYIVLLFL